MPPRSPRPPVCCACTAWIVFTDVLALEDGQGGVINPADRSDKAIAMRELLTTVEDDEGFESTLTPDGTGLLIAYKK